MDRGFRFLCQAETTRLVSFVGITVAIVFMVQYSELPSSKFLSSVTTKFTSFTMDTSSSVNSKVEGNNLHLNGSNSNSTHALEEKAISPQVPQFHNDRDSITSPAPEKAKGLDGSPMRSVQGRELNLA